MNKHEDLFVSQMINITVYRDKPGPNAIQGLLLYVDDGYRNRFGNFEESTKFVSKSECGGNGTTSTLQHRNYITKELPINFIWSPSESTTSRMAYIHSLVLRNFDAWFITQVITFNLALDNINIEPNENAVIVNTFNFFERYSLFIVVFAVFIVIYLVGAFNEYLLKKQEIKERASVKKSYSVNIGEW
ncbi:hypothetical protein C1645_739203 [Glomus cerebriforme]|uniref:Reelin domain-containing protein n=1 Tax=Glomus cerebriforme TaxID=658196 RepID=A0A397SXZ4_9GLOM|nr:hypothetical protein C1645_739203 [Glomus cerebriforme]